jgi:lipoyl(octanoyl) transferase
MRTCQVRRLGVVTYENGMRMQQKLVEMRQRDALDDQLLLLEHSPVITLGRGGDIGNLLVTPETLRAAGVRFFETTRGGDITYHGPGQIVGYPIIHLGEGARDIRNYVTKLEEVLIRTVADFGITATREQGKRGIWVGNDKIAAIGVRIARWVTSHGFALNVSTNLEHFRFITPCGLAGTGVTSIALETGREVALPEVESVLLRHFAEVFHRTMVPLEATIRVVKVVVHDGRQVLLLHRRPERGNFWQPISGSIEPGEEALPAARRELYEETGQNAEPEELGLEQSFLIESQFLEARYPAPIFADEIGYSARIDSSLPVLIDREEHDEYGWFPLQEAYEKIRWSDDREALERVEALLSLESDVDGVLSGPDGAPREPEVGPGALPNPAQADPFLPQG